MASAGWAAATCLSRLMCSGCWGRVPPRLEYLYRQTIGEHLCSLCCCSREHSLSASLLQGCRTPSSVGVFDAAWFLSPPAWPGQSFIVPAASSPTERRCRMQLLRQP